MILLTIALAIITPIAACALNSWLNIKIKFAPDAAQAKRDVKLVFLRIFNWFCVIYPACMLVWLLTLPEPMTRLIFVSILIQCFGLFNTYLLHWVNAIYGILNTHTETLRVQTKSAGMLADMLSTQAEGTKYILDELSKK